MQKPRNRTWSLLLIVLTLAALAPGCLPPQNENILERLAIIIGLGIDVEQDNPDTYIFTTTNPVFGEHSDKSVVQITTTGPSIEVALRNWQYQRHRKFALGKLSVVIIGQNLAETGLKEITVKLRQTADANVLAQVVYFPGKPQDAWAITPPSDSRPAVVLMQMLEMLFQEGLMFQMSICDLNSIIQNPDRDGFLPRLELSEDENRFQITGLAILDRVGRLAAVLNDTELVTFLLLTSDAEGAVSSTKVEYEGKEAIANFLIKRHGRTKTRVSMVGQKPQINLTIPIEVEIPSIRITGIELVTRDFIQAMEDQIAAELATQAQKLITKLQRYDSDPIGLGQWVRIHQTRYYNQGTWRDDYSTTDIRVDFNVKVTRVNVATERR